MVRPKKENARRKQFRIRMTEDEHRKLADIADRMQMNMSDTIRELIKWMSLQEPYKAESEDVQ